MKTFFKCLVLVCGAVFYFAAYSQTIKTVKYPEGFRRWVHVKSAFIGPESPNKKYGGLHHIYANDKALEGFKTGKFHDGAVIVFDLLETQTKDGVTAEGARRFIDVMRKDSRDFVETGGWGFEEFRGDSRTERALNEQDKSKCFACHASRKDKDFVFSFFRE
jgi:hypothetical protein